ncbi:MAG: metallophosphoesterase [Chitinophagales bacterium]
MIKNTFLRFISFIKRGIKFQILVGCSILASVVFIYCKDDPEHFDTSLLLPLFITSLPLAWWFLDKIGFTEKHIEVKKTIMNNASFAFIPKALVQWWDFAGLMKTFSKVTDSEKTLSFIDKREIYSITPQTAFEYHTEIDKTTKTDTERKELWLDFVADTGDGFNGTTSVFYTLTRDTLTLGSETLNAGKVLVIGGDLVYPHATDEEYTNRLKGPIRFVFPKKSSNNQTDLFAIPGNHDWYDGLSAFSRMLFQDSTIGNYKTKQKRSYFILKLRSNLHLLAIDSQLLGDIDIPQMNYFSEYVNALPDDVVQNLIIIVPEPSWYDYEKADTDKRRQRFNSVRYMLKELQRNAKTNKRNNISVKILIAGDIHHYAKYKMEGLNDDTKKLNEFPEYLFTSGGGGAFKHITSSLKEKIELSYINANNNFKDEDKTYKKQDVTFPDKNISNFMRLKGLFLPLQLYNLAFPYLVGTFSLISFALFYTFTGRQSISVWNNVLHNHLNLCDLLMYLLKYPFAIIPALLTPSLFYLILTSVKPKEINSKKNTIYNIINAALTLIVLVCQSILWFIVFEKISVMQVPHFHFLAITYWLYFLSAGFLYAFILGIVLLTGNLVFDLFVNEISSPAYESGYLNFLRMKIEEKTITIYTIGIEHAYNWESKVMHRNKVFTVEDIINKASENDFLNNTLKAKIIDKTIIDLQ